MTAKPERVVLDTNVLLSAVLFGGRPGELVELARIGRIRAVTSLQILQEFQRVLTRPRFGVSATLAEDLVLEIASFMDVVPVGPSRAAWTSDPADDPVVETALHGRAAVIVTGDRRLLQAAVPGVGILTVAETLERIAGL
ncbi:MAG: putative toxin-antitoxin system toxin component, PIN family [bacterium]